MVWPPHWNETPPLGVFPPRRNPTFLLGLGIASERCTLSGIGSWPAPLPLLEGKSELVMIQVEKSGDPWSDPLRVKVLSGSGS